MATIAWERIRSDYHSLLEELSQSTLDRTVRATLQRKAGLFGQVITIHDELERITQDLSDLNEQVCTESDEDMKALFLEEAAELAPQKERLDRELDDLLFPTDEHDGRSVFVELRAGAGGQEAALFVYDLYSMYKLYAEAQGWDMALVESSQTDLGGYKELIAHIKGKGVYKKLKYESGVHRVQRVPATETQGRVHTSTVTVAMLPEADEVDVDINPNDLRIDTYRAGGAGGQHVNKTDSAVRITHIPSGIVVQCQDERSQLKNKNRAMKVLQSRLLEAEKSKKAAEQSANRKAQVGSGDRSEKIRTYNYPQNRLSDHRINLTLKKLDIIMQGAFGEVVEPLLEWERTDRRNDQSPFFIYMQDE